MSNLPNAIRDLPAFMERLMGNHAGICDNDYYDDDDNDNVNDNDDDDVDDDDADVDDCCDNFWQQIFQVGCDECGCI